MSSERLRYMLKIITLKVGFNIRNILHVLGLTRLKNIDHMLRTFKRIYVQHILNIR